VPAIHARAAARKGTDGKLTRSRTGAGHREPRERRGRQTPAPARRQGSRRAIQKKDFIPRAWRSPPSRLQGVDATAGLWGWSMRLQRLLGWPQEDGYVAVGS
jgi:hypothetical protein